VKINCEACISLMKYAHCFTAQDKPTTTTIREIHTYN